MSTRLFISHVFDLYTSTVHQFTCMIDLSGVFTESPTHFVVNAQSVMPNGNGRVDAILTTPTGNKIQTLVGNNDDGTYNVLYTPMEQGIQHVLLL